MCFESRPTTSKNAETFRPSPNFTRLISQNVNLTWALTVLQVIEN
jgi:hypothetical protein